MKDIQKALEKARQERQAAAAATPERTPVSASTPEPPVAAVVAGGPEPQAAASAAMPLRQTRSIAPSNTLLENHRIIAGLNSHALADTFRVLRTRVLHRLDKAGSSTLAVTSAGRGEGKTLTAVNLAMSLALNLNRTVLLVDLDLRAPKVHQYLGIDRSPGLSDYLVHDAPLVSCLVNPGLERLVVLPAGGAVPGSSELLSSPRMTGLAQELKSRYTDRIIIYDFPPMLASDDALVFMRQVEKCLLVVEDGRTSKQDLQHVIELLADVSIIGTILNKSKIKPRQHYYYE